MHTITQFTTYLENNRYPYHLIKSYQNIVQQFFQNKTYDSQRSHIPVEQQMRTFLEDQILYQDHSKSFKQQAIKAIKLYYKFIYNKPLSFDHLATFHPAQKLPLILTKKEINTLIASAPNLKYKTILTAVYSGGLRLSELINLEMAHIDYQHMTMLIPGKTAAENRHIALAYKFYEMLNKYYARYRPRRWVFEGQCENPFSRSGVAKAFKKSLQNSGLNKPATIHTLRHSFAAHLLENGIDIYLLQSILGHRSIKTTQVYAKLVTPKQTNVKSPWDE